MKLPTTFEEISEEIVWFTDLTLDEAKAGVWSEALSLGSTARQYVPQLKVTPHFFDAQMEDLYKTTDAFIFECLVFWAKPERQFWIKQSYDRILRHAAEKNVNPAALKILILGDGAGSDSLFLMHKGLHVDYFDVPGSKTFEFAVKRFDHYRAIKRRTVNLVTDYSQIEPEVYDVVISFEVLEHLPDPLAAISDISLFLKTGGIALVTEAFEQLYDSFPTHLESNRQYSGRTSFLFRKNNLALSWYSRLPLFKPLEFVKQAQRISVWRLLSDGKVMINYLNNRFAYYKVKVKEAMTKKPPRAAVEINFGTARQKNL